MKRSLIAAGTAICLALCCGPAGADLINGGFESGMTGWTAQYAQDGSNGGYSYELGASTAYHFSGAKSLWGKAYVVGDYSDWSQTDWADTYAWSAMQDLRNLKYVQLYLRGFDSDATHLGWGWGQEIYLVISDGTNSASACLIENHQQTFGSMYDSGAYTTVTGNDGQSWLCFQVPNNATFFGSGITSVNHSSAKVGIMWEAVNWNSSPETLWAGAYVDDVSLVPVPEPATLTLLALGSLALLRRRKK